jgi:hypothetical protein
MGQRWLVRVQPTFGERSPDGLWWWNGQEWFPANPGISVGVIAPGGKFQWDEERWLRRA